LKDRFVKLLVIADPFPVTGGNYRARRSLLEYPRRGIEPYLMITPLFGYDACDEGTLLELVESGVRLAGLKVSKRENTSSDMRENFCILLRPVSS